MTNTNNAVDLYKKTFTCSQAIFAGFSETFGMDQQTALKTSCAFGGGCGRLGLTCGAVTGAFMVLGLAYGRSNPSDIEAKDITYSKTQEFAKRFVAKNGSLNCTELLGYDLGKADGYSAAKEKGLFTTLCLQLVRDSAQILEELLEEKTTK